MDRILTDTTILKQSMHLFSEELSNLSIYVFWIIFNRSANLFLIND